MRKTAAMLLPLALGGCGPPVTPQGGTGAASRRMLESGGYTWSYHLVVPDAGAAPVASGPPMVILLHGSGSDGLDYLEKAGWADAAQARGFVMVAPDGLPAEPTRPPNPLTNPRLWSAGQPDCPPARAVVDDVGMIDALQQDVRDEVQFDPQRVFAVGHSGGGSLAFRYAAERPERLRGLAVVAGHCWITPSRLERSIPTLLIVGTADPLFPLQGGEVRSGWLDRQTPPLAETIARWDAALGLNPTPVLELVLLEGQGHRWPGADVPDLPAAIVGPAAPGYDATGRIGDFLSALAEQPAGRR